MQTRPLAARRYDARWRNDRYPLRSIAIYSDLFARQVPADPTMYVPPPTSKQVALVEDSGLALARQGLSIDALQQKSAPTALLPYQHSQESAHPLSACVYASARLKSNVPAG